MTGRPTRQQVVDVLMAGSQAWSREWAEQAASDLIRAGLVEEPRGEGFYWVKYSKDHDWYPWLWRAESWYDGSDFITPTDETIIHPVRITTPPEEA